MNEKDKIYGTLITDFANAKTTDEASLKYLENISRVFNLSPQFTETEKRNFTTMEAWETRLNKLETRICHTIMEEKKYKLYLNYYFRHLASVLIGCDVEKKTLLLSHYNQELDFDNLDENGHPTTPVVLTDSYEIPIEDIAKRLDEKRELDLEPEKITDLYDDIDKFIKVNITLGKIKKRVSANRYLEIKELGPEYEQSIDTHQRIESIQIVLRRLLDDIVNEVDVSESPAFKGIMERYSKINALAMAVTSKEDIVKNPFPQLESLLTTDGDVDSFEYYDVKFYNEPISYCVVMFLGKLENNEFTKNPENISHLKKCKNCFDFFISIKNDKRTKYCRKCSPKNKMTKKERNEYMKDYRPKRKKVLGRRKREALIKQYMESGDTMEQAESRISS